MDDSPRTLIAQDRLRREELAERVTTYLRELDLPNDSLHGRVVGLLGAWGSGKTTVMHFVEEKLKADGAGETRRVQTVWIDLWAQDASDNILLAIVRKLEKNIREEAGEERGLQLGALGKLVARAEPFAALVHPTAGLVAKGAKAVLNALADSQTEKQKALEGIREEFNQLEKCFLSGEEGRLVIFLDDLDRCTPAHMIAIMEGVHNLLVGERTIYVIGVDPEVFGRALRWKYGDTFRDEDGILYLEKILVPCFHVTGTDTSRLIAEVWDGSDFSAALELAQECARDARFAGLTNPRDVKRASFALRPFLDSIPGSERLRRVWGVAKMTNRPAASHGFPGLFVLAALFNLILMRQLHPGFYRRLHGGGARRRELIRHAWRYWFVRRTERPATVEEFRAEFTRVWGEDPEPHYYSGALALCSQVHGRLCEAREGGADPEPEKEPMTPEKPKDQPNDGRLKDDAGMINAALFLLDIPLL